MDLVLLDLAMPGLPGEKVLEALRRMRPDLPVLISSGYTSAESQSSWVAARASAFVGKPYRIQDLAITLREVLREGAVPCARHLLSTAVALALLALAPLGDAVAQTAIGELDVRSAFGQPFFRWYNHDHHHAGLGYLTPAVVHYGRAPEVRAHRAAVLTAAYAAHPERFVREPPAPAPLPDAVWINRPALLTAPAGQ